MNKLNIIILAAGKGSRMKSCIPKVLLPVAGKPMIQYIIDTSKSLNPRIINLVCGHKAKLLFKKLNHNKMNWVFQPKQIGTGNAVKKTIPYILDNDNVLILYGDVPFICNKTLTKLLSIKTENGIALLTSISNKPEGYGRILRKNGNIIRIIEHNDLNRSQTKITEINSGVFTIRGIDLKRWVLQIKNNNKDKEYHITDIINFAVSEGREIKSIYPQQNKYETAGINNYLQLIETERLINKQKVKQLIINGTKIVNPNRFDLRGILSCGNNVTIDNDVIIEGTVTLGHSIFIGNGCILKNCKIDNGSIINAYSIIEDSLIGRNVTIGPFAHLRSGSIFDTNSEVGNFVEIKKTHFGKKSKIKHFSYIGDSEIGKNVNIGAGTITCNFNGKKKLKTKIGNNVFVGCGTQLVAPITIKDKCFIAAGTTVLKSPKTSCLIYNKKQQNFKDKEL